MGNSKSKLAKKLPQVASQATKPVQHTRIEASQRTEPAPPQSGYSRPDGHDPDSVSSRLSQLGPVQMKEVQQKYQPASADLMSTTLENRRRVNERDATLVKEQASGSKTMLPAQTITAVLRAIQAGDTRDDVLRSFQLNPEILQKLSALSLPKTQQVGRRRSA